MTANADGGPNLSASLTSYHEVHFVAGPPAALRGAISSPARGTFQPGEIGGAINTNNGRQD